MANPVGNAGSSRSAAWLLVAIGSLIAAGCGSELYEHRLANTKVLFAHMDLLNQNLQGAWNDPSVGVQLRAPLQFVLLPPPVKPEPAPGEQKGAKPPEGQGGQEGAEEGESEEPEIIDDRQPKYINIELPGLRGAFQAPVKVLSQGNSLADGEAYLYVMTNHDEANDIERAQEFEKNFVNTLSEAVHETVTDESWQNETFPARKGNFVRPVAYRSVSISPSEDIAGLARQFTLYCYQQGEIHVIVMFVVPKDVDAGERLIERIPLCLETLEVSGGTKLIAPVSGSGVGVGGSVPSF